MITVNMYDEDGEFKGSEKKNFFGECEKTIDRLNENRICSIGYHNTDKAFWIGESCDEWFTDRLSIEDCRNLAEMFSKMANMMEGK